MYDRGTSDTSVATKFNTHLSESISFILPFNKDDDIEFIHDPKIQEGLELFGKYYRALWD